MIISKKNEKTKALYDAMFKDMDTFKLWAPKVKDFFNKHKESVKIPVAILGISGVGVDDSLMEDFKNFVKECGVEIPEEN